MVRDSTFDNVLLELTGNYEVNSETACDLIKKHAKIMDSARLFGSYAYYPASQIAKEEGLKWTGTLDSQEGDDKDESDD